MDLCIISFNLNCIMQLKQFYNIATKVSSRKKCYSLRWRHNGCDSVSNHQPHHCLLNRLFRNRSKKTSKLRVTDLCPGNSPGTGEFPAQMASYAENVSIWWRHHVLLVTYLTGDDTVINKLQAHIVCLIKHMHGCVLLYICYNVSF